MDPGTLLADVGNFQEVGIEARGLERFPKSQFVHSGRTRCHNDAVNAIFLDVSFYQLLPRFRAHIWIIPGDRNTRQSPRKGLHPFNVDRSCNVDPAMADVNANPHDTAKTGALERWSMGVIDLEKDRE
jgi:hypothetical protein